MQLQCQFIFKFTARYPVWGQVSDQKPKKLVLKNNFLHPSYRAPIIGVHREGVKVQSYTKSFYLRILIKAWTQLNLVRYLVMKHGSKLLTLMICSGEFSYHDYPTRFFTKRLHAKIWRKLYTWIKAWNSQLLNKLYIIILYCITSIVLMTIFMLTKCIFGFRISDSEFRNR